MKRDLNTPVKRSNANVSSFVTPPSREYPMDASSPPIPEKRPNYRDWGVIDDDHDSTCHSSRSVLLSNTPSTHSSSTVLPSSMCTPNRSVNRLSTQNCSFNESLGTPTPLKFKHKKESCIDTENLSPDTIVRPIIPAPTGCSIC